MRNWFLKNLKPSMYPKISIQLTYNSKLHDICSSSNLLHPFSLTKLKEKEQWTLKKIIGLFLAKTLKWCLISTFFTSFFCKTQSNLSSFFVRTGALQTFVTLRSATSTPEGLKYRSSGSGYSYAPLRGAKILNAPLQRSGRSVKCLMLRLRSAPQHWTQEVSSRAKRGETSLDKENLGVHK